MAERDARHEPVVGDVFETGSGMRYRILDHFISYGTKPGSSGNPGYFVEESKPDGSVSTGTSSRGVFRNKIRKAKVLHQADTSPIDWSVARRLPHGECTAMLREQHRREQ